MKNKKWTLITVVSITVLILCIFGYNIYQNSLIKDSYVTLTNHNNVYTDTNFDFSISFPEEWSYKIDDVIKPTAEREGSPDGGIMIYVNKEKSERIYVKGSLGQIGIKLDDFSTKKFKANSGLTGNLYRRISKEKIEEYLISSDEFHMVYIYMDINKYSKYENQITEVLKSLEIR